VGKLERRRQIVRPRCSWANRDVGLKEIGFEGIQWIYLIETGTGERLLQTR
jgi:hypothetical protein